MKTTYLLPLAVSLLLGCSSASTLEPDVQGDLDIATPDLVSGDVTPGDSGIKTLNLGDHNYEDIAFPAHFKAAFLGGSSSVLGMDNTPGDNPITNAGASLGRVLFYDVNLSANSTISCGSCHKAEFGFSDDRVLSKGFEDGETGRHAMSLTNARFYAAGMFFWDQRAATLEEQVLMPFQDPVEMGMTLETLVAAVEAQGFYPSLFEAAFGDSEVTTERVAKALAQFVRSLVSYQSRYDEGRAQVAAANVDFPNFTAEENLGKQIFMNTPMAPNGAGCLVCHTGEAMVSSGANSNGLDSFWDEDAGYGEVTGMPGDMGTFKTPSLRNVAVRARFMHDGRFSTLREVIDHYADTVKSNPNLGVPLSMHKLNLDESEREALVAFLETLTDEAMLTDPKFSNPFE